MSALCLGVSVCVFRSTGRNTVEHCVGGLMFGLFRVTPYIVMCTLVLRMNREEHSIKGGVQVHTPGLFCVSYSFKVYYTRLLEGTAISLRR